MNTTSRRPKPLLSVAAIGLLAAATVTGVAINGGGEGGEDSERDIAVAGHAEMVTGTVWVANEKAGTLSAIDAATNQVVTSLEGIEGPTTCRSARRSKPVGCERSRLTRRHDRHLAKVDVARRRLVDTLKVGDGPIQTFANPDNQYLLVANQGDERDPGTTVSLIDLASFTLAGEVETGEGAHGIVVAPP